MIATARQASFKPTAERPVDWARVEDWTLQLASGETSPVCDEMERGYGQRPTVIWNPGLDQLASERLACVLRYWTFIKNGRDLPGPEPIDPLRMRSALGYVMLLDAVEGGRDFCYRLFGSKLAAVSGFDMTGRRLSDLGASVWVIEFTLASCRAAALRREPVFTSRTPIGAQYTKLWHRIALPLTDEGGAVTRFLAATVPLAGSGETVSARL
jgi:hypothetical protein